MYHFGLANSNSIWNEKVLYPLLEVQMMFYIVFPLQYIIESCGHGLVLKMLHLNIESKGFSPQYNLTTFKGAM